MGENSATGLTQNTVESGLFEMPVSIHQGGDIARTAALLNAVEQGFGINFKPAIHHQQFSAGGTLNQDIRASTADQGQ